MQTMEKVIACGSGKEYPAAAREYARWAAERLSLPLEFLHPARARLHSTLVDDMVACEARTCLFVMGQNPSVVPAFGRQYWDFERAIRVMNRPILRASRTFRAPRRFALIFDGTPDGRRLLVTVSQTALLSGLECRVLAAGVARPSAFDQLRWAELTLRGAGFETTGQLLPYAEAAIRAYIDDADVDLLVLQAPYDWQVKHFFIGSTTLSLARTCPVPVFIYPNSPTLLDRRHMM
jgi:nucleotide-binding universal stress UspA family protein